MLKGAVLYAKDLGKLAEFYLVLGGTATSTQEGEFVTIEAHGSELIILQAPQHVASQIQITDPPAVRASTSIKPILLVDSIDETITKFPESGGMILPNSSQWEFNGHLVQDIVDPEGNVVQLWQVLTS